MTNTYFDQNWQGNWCLIALDEERGLQVESFGPAPLIDAVHSIPHFINTHAPANAIKLLSLYHNHEHNTPGEFDALEVSPELTPVLWPY